MSTRPRVTDVELSTTVRRIVNRRIKVDDPDRHLLPDDHEHPQVSEVLDYLQRHTRVPRWVTEADVADALTLNNYLWWQDRRRELAWLKAGIRRGLFLAQIGGAVGTGKQGVLDRIDRLEALLQFDRPDEQLTRGARRAAKAAAATHDIQAAWVDQHTSALTEIATGLATAADRHALADEEREWVDELARDAREEHFTPETMTLLSLSVEELRCAPGILALDSSRPYQVHEWLTRADRLRAAFAGLGVTTGRANPANTRHDLAGPAAQASSRSNERRRSVGPA